MKDKTTAPLRGEATWRAQLAAIAKRNDAARAAGARRRAAKDATVAREVAQLDQREMRTLRGQGGHSAADGRSAPTMLA